MGEGHVAAASAGVAPSLAGGQAVPARPHTQLPSPKRAGLAVAAKIRLLARSNPRWLPRPGLLCSRLRCEHVACPDSTKPGQRAGRRRECVLRPDGDGRAWRRRRPRVGALGAHPVAARDTVPHDLIKGERVKGVEGAAGVSAEERGKLLVHLGVAPVARLEVRLDLAQLEAHRLREELVMRKAARQAARLSQRLAAADGEGPARRQGHRCAVRACKLGHDAADARRQQSDLEQASAAAQQSAAHLGTHGELILDRRRCRTERCQRGPLTEPIDHRGARAQVLTGGEAREHVARVPAYARLGLRARCSKATSERLGDSCELGSQLAGSRQAARGLGFRGNRGLGGAHSHGATAPWLHGALARNKRHHGVSTLPTGSRGCPVPSQPAKVYSKNSSTSG